MTCSELISFLMDYIDGELSEPKRAAFEAHLAECPSCVAYFQTYQATRRLAGASFVHPDDPVPSGVPDGLVKAILAARAAEG